MGKKGKDNVAYIEYNSTMRYIPMPPQNARFRTTGALQFEARQ